MGRAVSRRDKGETRDSGGIIQEEGFSNDFIGGHGTFVVTRLMGWWRQIIGGCHTTQDNVERLDGVIGVVVSNGGDTFVASSDLSSGLSPISYSNWAAGGGDGWRYQASSKSAWWLVFTMPDVRSMYLIFCVVAE